MIVLVAVAVAIINFEREGGRPMRWTPSYYFEIDMKLNTSDIFLEPVGDELGLSDANQVYVMYSPLTEGLALVSGEDAARIIACARSPEGTEDHEVMELIAEMTPERMPSVEDLTPLEKTAKLSVLPNLTCNFSCSYCYSAKGRSKTVIEWGKVKAVLDYFIDEKRLEPQPLSIFISGGGEPLLSWNIVERLLEYAGTRAKEKGYPLYMSVVTNGSLLTEDIADSLKRHDSSVCISFEVLRDLQDGQRNHYSQVRSNLLMLGEKGVRTMVNSTITPKSVLRMTEMVEEVVKSYPYVAQYTMEPVTGWEMFSSPDDMRRFYDHFYEEYLRCKEIAERNELNLRFTFDDSFRGITLRHCPGQFALTPSGTISACHLTSSPKESRYERCVYGRVTDSGEIEMDKDKFKALRDINVYAYERCSDCFAKWICGGECMARNDAYPEEYMKEVCRFNRRFVKHVLIEELRRTVFEETGLSLEEYVKE